MCHGMTKNVFKSVFKNDIKHKFAVIDSYGNEQTESNIIKTEYEKEFQQSLESRQITPKYRNIQEITDKMFDTCSGISKVQHNQPEITKDEVQSAVLLAHKCYDLAGLKYEVFKACVRYFSLFLKDKCISLLVRTKYIEKKFTLQLFFLSTVSRTFILSWATTRYPPP